MPEITIGMKNTVRSAVLALILALSPIASSKRDDVDDDDT